MSEQQLRLFAPPKPLLERLGTEFFAAVPTHPGVYLMLDARNRVVYVGQSKNLRHRLASYKHAHPDRVARKIIRLIHCVEYVLWQECDTAAQARIRENQLLRAFRPKFNSVNTYPQAYCFVGLESSETRLRLLATRERFSTKGECVLFGAFKTKSFRGYQALLRLLWGALHQPASPHEMPRPLLTDRPPVEFEFDLAAVQLDSCTASLLRELLSQFLEGVSNALVEFLRARLPLESQMGRFQQELFKVELEMLEHFYRIGPERNLRLRQNNGLEDPIIAQEMLDDLLVGDEGSPATLPIVAELPIAPVPI